MLYPNFSPGPPLRSLNEDVVAPPEKMLRLEMTSSSSATSPADYASNGGLSKSHLAQQQKTEPAKRNVEIEPELGENGEGAEEENIYWVTVFGFGPEQTEHIIELFSRHGDIMAQKVRTF